MKKRLLYVCNSLYGGGAERVLQTIVKNIDRDKFEVTVCSVLEECVDEALYPGCDVKYIFRQRTSGLLSSVFLKMTNKIKLLIYKYLPPRVFYSLFVHGSYDVEVAFIEGYSTRIVSGSRNSHSKKLAWLHIDISRNHWGSIAYRNKKEESVSYGRFDNVVCVSNDVLESYKKEFPKLNNGIVLYNPIDSDVIRLRSEDVIAGMERTGHFRFLSVGRLVWQKGYDRLIPIVKQLFDKGLDLELWILGEGEQRSLLEGQIRALGLNDRVKLFGYLENPYAVFKYCDAFVCSSRAEGYSTVVTESLILGMPVVATDCSGIREQIGVDSEFGIITENDDSALADGMQRMMQPDVFSYYRKAAALRGQAFDLNKLISEHEKLYVM